MSIRIAHLSDPHFGMIKPIAMEALLVALKILSPQVVILSGDITQRARDEQFEQARIFANTFENIPLIIQPGNHDLPMFNVLGRMLHPYDGFTRILGGKLNQEVDIGSVQILGMNSTRRTRTIQGELDLDILKTKLKKKTNKKIRIAVFHHPLDCPKYVDEKNLLTNRDEVVPLLAEGHVDLVLGGHIHDPYTCLSNHRYPKVDRHMIIGIAGTCLSTRTRADANNSFNVIDVLTDQEFPKLSISRFDLVDNKIFEATESHRFIRKNQNKGWERD